MTDLNDINDMQEEEEQQPSSHISKKKIIIFLLPTLIAIGIVVGMHHTFDSSNKNINGQPYSILEQQNSENEKTIVFYDIPPVAVPVRNPDGTQDVINFKLSIELNNKNDIPNIEILLPRLYDVIIAHTRELTKEEVQGANGLYWLKEELLYRLNLAAAPIKISDIDFKSIDVSKK